MAKRSTRSDRCEPRSSLQQLAIELGIPASEVAWLEQALTHRSCTRERGDETRESNERLEFLGDAVAQFIVSLMLYERYPRWSEGQLTRARAAVVSREPMVRAALRIHLGDHLRLGRTEEEQGGRTRPSILACAFEAVVAAVYLTSGMDAASRFIRTALDEELDAAQNTGGQRDYKTRLQESCQLSLHLTPVYQVVDISGPDHDRTFKAEAYVAGELRGVGIGRTKKEAEQESARQALQHPFPFEAGAETEPGD